MAILRDKQEPLHHQLFALSRFTCCTICGAVCQVSCYPVLGLLSCHTALVLQFALAYVFVGAVSKEPWVLPSEIIEPTRDNCHDSEHYRKKHNFRDGPDLGV